MASTWTPYSPDFGTLKLYFQVVDLEHGEARAESSCCQPPQVPSERSHVPAVRSITAMRTAATDLSSVAVPDKATDRPVKTWLDVGALAAAVGVVVSGTLTSKGTEVRGDALP